MLDSVKRDVDSAPQKNECKPHRSVYSEQPNNNNTNLEVILSL